jgi:hypothetical protein
MKTYKLKASLLLLIPVFNLAYADLINGNFENGLTGWTTSVEGAALPITVTPLAATTAAGTIALSLTGDNYMYTSQTSPGRSILTQAFTVTSSVNTLFFDVAINNAGSGGFFSPDSLSYNTSGVSNQQARFEILVPGATRTTTTAADIIIKAFQTSVGDTARSGWTRRSIDISSALAPYVGQNVIFRLAQIDNGGNFNLAIDNINIGLFQFDVLPDTQLSLARLVPRLRSIFNHQALISNFSNSNTYDCNLFDVKGMCISAGGRYSTVDNPSSNSTAAVVTLGYKVNSNIRIGGFLDQSINNNNPTGINVSNKNPMMGAFAYWNQSPDGLGYQVKLANAYQDKDLSTTRDVIGINEAGRGTTSLTTQSYVGELSYAFMFKENTLVRPYFALRHTKIEQDAYTETGVLAPLTYNALNDRTTSALMGVKFKHALTPKANLTGSLGLEQDLHHKTDQLTASGVSGLTSENFSGDIHRTRPVASIGATYDIAKTQRLSGEVLVQQLPFQSTAGATAYFNYMIGF